MKTRCAWLYNRQHVIHKEKSNMPSTLPVLSLLETRVLGVLAEKQRTVPDSYPLTLNSLVSGCNQKSSRDPVIEATESEVAGGAGQLAGVVADRGDQRGQGGALSGTTSNACCTFPRSPPPC